MANALDVGQLCPAMAANIAGNHMQVVNQVFNKGRIGSGTKSIGMQQMGRGPGSTPI